jgi:predicted nuclease with TOPRIM domain
MKKKKIKNLLFGVLIFGGVLIVSLSAIPGVYAQNNDAQIISDKIGELIEKQKELKNQIDAGEISIEEAQEEWKKLVDDLRAEKEDKFSKKFQSIKVRAKILKALHPAYESWIIERVSEAQARKIEYQKSRLEVSRQLLDGEITREEAREKHKEFIVYHNRRAAKKIEELELLKEIHNS